MRMRIPFTHLAATVGREDRLVRGCVAMSLLLMASFPVMASRGLNPITVGFVGLVLYFAVTAVSGRDPLYVHFGIDTLTEGDRESLPFGRLFIKEDPAQVVDVRHSRESPTAAS